MYRGGLMPMRVGLAVAAALALRPHGARRALLLVVTLSLSLVMMMVAEHELPGLDPSHPSQLRWHYFYPLFTTIAWAFYLTLAIRLAGALAAAAYHSVLQPCSTHVAGLPRLELGPLLASAPPGMLARPPSAPPRGAPGTG